uniref:Uncharacterized protein n=1 Tax=Sphaerodactylus townsendi TaxID=933632 RepID=A0ACB8FEX9_9SAUR
MESSPGSHCACAREEKLALEPKEKRERAAGAESGVCTLNAPAQNDFLVMIMPDQITVSEFISETTEDYNSPTTSSFTTRLQNCRNTVTLLEEGEECLPLNEHPDVQISLAVLTVNPILLPVVTWPKNAASATFSSDFLLPQGLLLAL